MNTPNKSTALTPQQKQIQTLRHMLEGRKAQIQKFAGQLLDPERVTSLALLACTKNPALLRCTQDSIVQAVYDAARLGLEPDGVQGALVPFGQVATFLPMVQGLVGAAYEDESVQAIKAVAVYEGDPFDVDEGTKDGIYHKPDVDNPNRGNPSALRAVYATAVIRGHVKFDWMSKAEIESIRLRSPSVKRGKTSPWGTFNEKTGEFTPTVNDYVEMAKKTILKRMCKTMPRKSHRLRAMLAHDDEATRREDELIDMTVTQAPEPTPDERDQRRMAAIADAQQGNASASRTAPAKDPRVVEIGNLFERIGCRDAEEQDRYAKFAVKLPAETDWTKLDAALLDQLKKAIESDVASQEAAARGDADGSGG